MQVLSHLALLLVLVQDALGAGRGNLHDEAVHGSHLLLVGHAQNGPLYVFCHCQGSIQLPAALPPCPSLPVAHTLGEACLLQSVVLTKNNCCIGVTGPWQGYNIQPWLRETQTRCWKLCFATYALQSTKQALESSSKDHQDCSHTSCFASWQKRPTPVLLAPLCRFGPFEVAPPALDDHCSCCHVGFLGMCQLGFTLWNLQVAQLESLPLQ